MLVRDVPEGQQRIPGFFSTLIYDVDDTQHLDLQQVAAHLSKQLDDFNRYGSGFVLGLQTQHGTVRQRHGVFKFHVSVDAKTTRY